jgi:hypothetical protein
MVKQELHQLNRGNLK